MAALSALVVLVGCANEEGETEGEECLSNEAFFQERVYSAILANDCASCHNDSGDAKDTSFILRGSEWGPNYNQQNLEMFAQLAKLEYEGEPWIILKPTQTNIGHEGGQRFTLESEQVAVFREMIERLENPVICDDTTEDDFFADVTLLDEVATLRKATLSLTGRLPTLEEEQSVRDGGLEALDTVLDRVMQENAFYDRLKEIYNDNLLTDKYYPPGEDALSLLDGEIYPTVDWYIQEYGEGSEEAGQARDLSNRAVAREPLELIAHVVRNDLPYTEVLTADYTMVNYYSARVFGIDYPGSMEDPTAFVAAKVPGVPHAGLLTSTVYLVRFPTTDTNRNRHRSRMFYEFFLATDVQALGNRPVDAAAIAGVNPTLNDANCTICHDIIDPVAGGFQNWDAMGRYIPPEMGWYPDLLPAGFGDAQLPVADTDAALQWMVREAVQDRRFAISAIHLIYRGLTGQNPLKEPDDPQAEGYLEAISAAKKQFEVFDEIAQKFIDDGYNLKTVFKELIKSPYYRANNASTVLDSGRSLELKDVGTGHLLTPEQLARKVQATTGYPWRPDRDNAVDYLLDTNQYRILYGGIDSNNVVKRISEPNGVMANILMRMANEMACTAVPRDFAKQPADRVMFPLVDVAYEPEDENGFEVPAAAAAIRANIQFLVHRLWGQELDINDPEINRIFALFVGVWEDGKQGMALPDDDENRYGTGLPSGCNASNDFFTGEPLATPINNDPNYTIRAWMAVLTYMLSDFEFSHE